MMMVKTVIFDFDNTLYDWVHQWYSSFSALLSGIAEISGIPDADLKPEIQKIFRQHHTSEYAFVIEDLEMLGCDSPDARVDKYRAAITAYRDARSSSLRLYPKVLEVIHELRGRGIKLVVFTESQSFYTIQRFKKMGLDGLFDALFTSEDHDLPPDDYLRFVRSHPPERYELQHTPHRSVRRGHLKPDKHVLLQIIDDVGALPAETIYVGDSLFKDVLMANDAGVVSAWAKYGEARNGTEYTLLQDVSHWSDEDILKDKKLKLRDVKPDFVLESGIEELLDILN